MNSWSGVFGLVLLEKYQVMMKIKMVVAACMYEPSTCIVYSYVFILRRHSIQTEGFSGLYSLSATEWHHTGSGGEGQRHPRGPGGMPGPLQQLRLPLPEPGPLCGATQQLRLRLQLISVHRSLL